MTSIEIDCKFVLTGPKGLSAIYLYFFLLLRMCK